METYKTDRNTILSEKPPFSFLHCSICRHKIVNHLHEDGIYRCHSIGPDLLQCECRLDNPYEYIIEFRTTVLFLWDFPEQMFKIRG